LAAVSLLMKYKLSVEDSQCNGCGLCVTICPAHFIIVRQGDKKVARFINAEGCQLCCKCEKTCPRKAINHLGMNEGNKA